MGRGSNGADGNFNPRSLAGATGWAVIRPSCTRISIHAPSRERHACRAIFISPLQFQSTLPRGSDRYKTSSWKRQIISIHAPSRERLGGVPKSKIMFLISIHAPSRERPIRHLSYNQREDISIHAPSRERPQSLLIHHSNHHFNPRSLAGATYEEL